MPYRNVIAGGVNREKRALLLALHRSMIRVSLEEIGFRRGVICKLVRGLLLLFELVLDLLAGGFSLRMPEKALHLAQMFGPFARGGQLSFFEMCHGAPSTKLYAGGDGAQQTPGAFVRPAALNKLSQKDG